MKTSTKQQIFAYLVLLVLLVIRFPVADFVLNLARLFGLGIPLSSAESLRQIQNWSFYSYERWSFALVGIAVIANRENLKDSNIDKYFIFLLAICGLSYGIYFFWPTGWLAVLVSVYLLNFFRNSEKEHVDPKPNIWQIVLVLVIGSFLIVLITSDTSVSRSLHHSIVRMPFVFIEEVLFRGLLWMLLRNLNWPETSIVVVQAVLFWLSHTYYMFTDPVLFWITAPVMSIILGIVVWRFKSITPSTIAHLFFNLLQSLA